MNKLIKLSKLLSNYLDESKMLLKVAQTAEEVDWQKLDGWLDNSVVRVPLYHGTGKVFDLKQIKYSPDGALGFGIYFTPEQDIARQYGDVLFKAWAKITNPLIIHTTTDSMRKDPCVELLIQLGEEPKKAMKMVEKAYEDKGYVGKQIYARATAKGHDAILQHIDGKLAEVVIWDKSKLALTTDFMKT
jgi:hypothetical protein